jgi:para-aminobenzoate synthetase component 1
MRTITRTPMPGWLPAEAVMRAFGASGDVVWFDAGPATDRAGAPTADGYPERSLIGWGTHTITASARDAGSLETAWTALGASLAERSDDQASEPLGWWGVVGYGASASTLTARDERWGEMLGDPVHPDLALLEVERALVFEHGTREVVLVSSVAHDESATHDEWVDGLVAWWRGAVAARSGDARDESGPAPAPDRVAEWHDTAADYLALIARCQAAIRDGDAFVMCLTTAATVRGVDEPDLDVYARLRRLSPAPRASFARLGGLSLLSASPETFLTVGRGRVASSAPIKGTRERSADPATDVGRAEELRHDPKERAENLMIVDLMRNDLSRVAVPGGVEVERLFEVRSFAQVHQLVSTITARLAQEATAVDVVRAVFPPGSMTGAPKHSVVSLLASWERAPRGVYSGAVGRFGFDGTVDLAVVIRSVALDTRSRVATVGVGGGVTALSDPRAELAEIVTKARAPLASLGAVI